MKAWEFSKALHLQQQNSWTRFVSMQDNYSLLAREEETEMLPLCADEGIETIVYSPLARGRLARPWSESSTRAQAEPYVAKLTEATAESDEKIVGVVESLAKEHGVSMAQIALAWVRNEVVTAPIVGVLKTSHIDDAIASLSILLSDEEVSRLEAPYTPRRDHQSVSDPKALARTAAAVGLKTAA
jgi:1-deoxyxylulose-5-phosphate synthase